MAGSGLLWGVPVRLWVDKCGSFEQPEGQIPPGGVVTAPTDPNATPTGKLKLLVRKGVVKATALNRKVTSRTVFKLRAPGGKKSTLITVAAGRVATATLKARPGKYVLSTRVKSDGKTIDKRVASLRIRPSQL